MNLPENRYITLEEYEELRKESDQQIEYIDGVVGSGNRRKPGTFSFNTFCGHEK